MRVPASSPQNNLTPKPVSCNPAGLTIGIQSHNNSSTPHAAPNLTYEPTSVLDLRRSPSPTPENRAAPPTETPSVHDVLSDPSGLEWDYLDTIMREFVLDDPGAPVVMSNPQFINSGEPQIPNFTELLPSAQQFDPTQFVLSDIYSNPNLTAPNLNPFVLSRDFHHSVRNSNVGFGFDFLQELVRVADCFDSNDLQLAQVILDRLNQRLRSPAGKPVQRAAFYFKEALQSLLSGSNRSARFSSWSDIVQTIKACKAFSGISPINRFCHFTFNQILLEALDGCTFVHVVDFEIGLGEKYASFMREIADRASPPVLRITAVVSEEYAMETKLIKENLTQFAQELKLRFHIEFVLTRSFEMLSFKSVKFMKGEKLAVHLSPTIFRRLGSPTTVAGFLNNLRRVSPSVVIFVDAEGWTEAAGATSFRRNFVISLEFYSMLFESLDAAIGGGEWARMIEMLLLRPKILTAVEGGGRRQPLWREVFSGEGLRPVQLSQFADFQAECLLENVQVMGFQVAKRQAELVLCWHERALAATSAWRC